MTTQEILKLLALVPAILVVIFAAGSMPYSYHYSVREILWDGLKNLFAMGLLFILLIGFVALTMWGLTS